MLDINRIREHKNEVQAALAKRLDPKDFDLDQLLAADDKRRTLVQRADELKAERNKHSKTKPTPEVIAQMKQLGEQIKKIDSDLEKVTVDFDLQLAELPNIPADDVLPGGKENNKIIKNFGKKPSFNFTPKDHVELATNLGIIDYERGAKIAGSGFWVYTGPGAQLEWALINYFKAFHDKNKYTFLLLPYLLTEQSAYASGQLPKFREDVYWTQDGLCLNGTSEMMLLNFHRDEILNEKELPLKYYSYSACFRREAGSYRKEERGMVRGHQFNKIEMFQFVKPNDSWKALDEMVTNASTLVEGLGLNFQTVQLAAQDASAAMSKTIDIEVWIPSMGIYKEVSSASNGIDYQARRGNIRFKNVATGKNEFVHTLNGSGLATSRLVPAILEQFQQRDGSVEIPKVLRKYCGFKKISPKK